MDYSRITVLMNKKRLSGNRLAKLLGKTGSGLRKMLSNETCSVKDLEKMCEIFEVPLSYFFENSEIPIVSEDRPKYQVSTDRIKMLEKLVASKDEIIGLLKSENDRLIQSIQGKKAG